MAFGYNRWRARKALVSLTVAWGMGSGSTLFGEASKAVSQPAASQPAATQPATQPAVDKSKILSRLGNDSNKPSDRLAAAKELLKLKAFVDLQGVLTVGSPSARTVVCEALRSASPPPAELIDALIAQLSQADGTVVAGASQTLAEYKDNGVSAKLAAVARDGKSSAATRVSAVRTLGLMHGHENIEALKALVAIVEDQKADGAIRKASRLALRGQEYQQLIDAYAALSTALMSKLDAKGQVDHQLANLKSPIPEVRLIGLKWAQAQKAANALKADSPVVGQVRAMIGDPDVEVRLAVLGLLTAVKDPKDSAGILAQYGNERNPEVRRAMIEALGALGSPGAISKVVEALKDPSEAISIAAAGALGQLCANIQAAIGKAIPAEVAKSVAAALSELGKAPDGGKRNTEALAAMAKIGHPSFGPVFTALLGHKDVNIRQQAVSGIGVIGNPDLLGPLRDRLGAEPEAAVRLAIVEVLGRLAKSDEDLATLFGRLDGKVEGDEKIRAAASTGLVKALKARPAEQMRTWARKFGANSGERLALLTNAEAKLSKANPAKPAELTACRVELGDTLVACGKPADAAAFYQAALGNHTSATSPNAKECVPLTAKLMSAWGAAGAIGKNIDAVAKYAASPVPGVKAEVGKAVVARLGALAKANQHAAVIQLADLVTAKVPDRFGGEFAKQIDAATLNAGRALVKTYLGQLKDAKQKEAATKALVGLGKRAVRPLAEEWKAILAAEKPDTALEGLLIEVLKQVEPSAKAQKFENKEQKEAFIAPLIK